MLGQKLGALLAALNESMSSNEVVREAQSVETYQAGAKQKAAAKLSRIPVKVEQGEVLRKPEWIRVQGRLARPPASTRSSRSCARAT